MSKSYRSQLVGCFGNPVDENPTGVMEEAAFREKGLDFRYLTVLVRKEDLGKAMDGVRAFNMRGVNLTIPHKVRVLQYLDELSEAARITGAVNMFWEPEEPQGQSVWNVHLQGQSKLQS